MRKWCKTIYLQEIGTRYASSILYVYINLLYYSVH